MEKKSPRFTPEQPQEDLPQFRDGEEIDITRGVPSEDWVRLGRDEETGPQAPPEPDSATPPRHAARA